MMVFGFVMSSVATSSPLVAAADDIDSTVATRWLDVDVNGVSVKCADGSRVLDAVGKSGFEVPTLCYDERVGPQGSCRMCLVEVESDGRVEQVASCTAFASDGMLVRTHTDDLRSYRKTLLEMLLSEMESPAGNLYSRKVGATEFDRAVEEYGARWDGLPRLKSRDKALHDRNPFIQRDYDYCIACYRCTNICNEWEQAGAITVDGRGQDSSIFSFFGNNLLDSPCTFCGQCINTCPTGALTDRKVVSQDISAGDLDRTRTICPYCGVGCGIELLSVGDEIVGAEPDFSAPSRGSLCVKGQFGSWEFVSSEERLRYPLIKDGSGMFRRASWDEALDKVADGFKSAIVSDGPDSVVCWASARVVTEANYLMQKFARVAIGTNNIDNCSRT